MALYRKYRPATFAEVLGQRHVTEPLSAALESRGPDGSPDRINHAYLFSGPRGCGKTSSARILARSLNCVEGPTATPCGRCDSCVALGPGGPGTLDVVELDAASHNSVDDMRDLREKAMYAPADARYRIFIIDEAHMVTTHGFNALLKIVEEPPEHLIFVFATTEPEKVIPTIRSRTHHYPFRLLAPNTMRGLLERVVGEEHVAVADDVYPLVVRAGGGSPRDSLSVMDQLLAGAGPNGVTYDLAAALLGVTDQSLLDDSVAALADGDRAALFGCVDRVVQSGQDPRRFAADLLERVRDLLVIAAVPDAVKQSLVDAPEDRVDMLHEQAAAIPVGTLTRFADVLHHGLSEMAGATSPRLLLEVLCARMLLPASENSLEAMVQRIEALERGMPAGSGAPAPASAQAGAAQSAPGGGAAQAAAPASAAPSAPAAQQGGDVDMSGMSPLQRARMNRGLATGGGRQAPAQTPPPQAPAPEQQVQPPAPASAPEPQAQPEPQVQPEQQAPRQPEPQQAPQHPEPQHAPAEGPASAQPQDGAQDQDEQARKAREAREASRRIQEAAREQERAERERMALEREAATRAAEGAEGSVPANWSDDRTTEEAAGATEAPGQDAPARDEAPAQPERRQEAAPQPEKPQEPQSQPQTESRPRPETTEQRPVADGGREAADGDAGASGSDDGVTIGAVRERWDEVLEASGDHVAVRVLATQAVPLELGDGELTIGHSTGALANRLNDPAYSSVLAAAVRTVHGIDVEVRCVVGTNPPQRETRSGARPRQHQAESAEGSEGASAVPERSPGDDGGESTIGRAQDVSGTAVTTPQTADPGEKPVHEMPQAEAERRVDAREAAQEKARENASPSPDSASANAVDSAKSATPVNPSPPREMSVLERVRHQRRLAEEARKRSEERNPTDQSTANQEPQRPRYQPPAPPEGTEPQQRRHRYYGDDAPPPPEPEPYDDVPPPPEPSYPDDGYGGAPGGYGAQGGQSQGQPQQGQQQPRQQQQPPRQQGQQQPRQQSQDPQRQPQHQHQGQPQQAQQTPRPQQSQPGYQPNAAPGSVAPGPAAVDDDGFDDEERELMDAARTPGELDHRDQKTVVMELLARELGAKPL